MTRRRSNHGKPKTGRPKAKRLNITVPDDVYQAVMNYGPHINVSVICADALIDFLEKQKAGVTTVSETLDLPGVGPLRIIVRRIESNEKKEEALPC